MRDILSTAWPLFARGISFSLLAAVWGAIMIAGGEIFIATDLIITKIYGLVLSPSYAIGEATAILASKQLELGRTQEAKVLFFKGLQACVLSTVPSCILVMLTAPVICSWAEINSTLCILAVQISVFEMLIAAVSCSISSLARITGATSIPLIGTVVQSWIVALPITLLFIEALGPLVIAIAWILGDLAEVLILSYWLHNKFK